MIINDFSREAQKGQVLLIIILVMVVSLTVGLSVVTRSITNLRVSTEEENSQRAFYAAEAGVERALKTTATGAVVSSPGQTLPDNFSKIESVNIQETSSQRVLLDKLALKDEASSLWLVDDPQNPPPNGWGGTLIFYWGKTTPAETCSSDEASNTMAAIEIIVITRPGNPIAQHYVYDPCSNRRAGNFFGTPATGTYSGIVTGMTFRYSATLPLVSQGILVQAVPLYANTPIAVSASGDALPVQERRIESIGSSGGTQHKIIVVQGNPKFPTEFFPYLVLSPL
ncbi:MAG: pilus assembly PilX N-terminal domain-containing protein [Candidatus Levybacteria bacterium]|nr:pilus assembly PilX N-terminal domain-containing protein [Candidatus Levybacteria bacterium]